MAHSRLLVLAVLLHGCFLAHGRPGAGGNPDGSPTDPSARDARVPLFDGSRPIRDGGDGRVDAHRILRDAHVVLPGVPDAGFEPTSTAHDYYTFCMRLGAVFCEPHVRCCGFDDRRIGSVDECLLLTQGSCFEDAHRASEFEGSLVWDAAAANAVLLEMAERGRTCEPYSAWKFETLVDGTIPEGGDCTPRSLEPGQPWASYACAGDLRCLISGGPDDLTGVCAPRGPLGAPCVYGFVDCEDGQFCTSAFHPPSIGECQPLRVVGSSCRGDRDCASGLCQAGVCAAPRTEDSWCYVRGGG